MKYFLRKRDNEFWLESRSENHCTVIAEQEPDVNDLTSKLSIKNCQAIERGWDLDELADKHANQFMDGKDHFYGFKAGFQKAVEILGDKKFSEADVINIAEYVRVASQSTPSVRTKDLFNEYQSLQQDEWDVEIEMERSKFISDKSLRNDIKNGFNYTPKLDADGCLILKKK